MRSTDVSALSDPLSDLALGADLSALPDAFAEALIDLRRHLHMHPEIGFEEHDTARHVRAFLARHGLEPGPTIARTGFFVDIEGAHPGPTVGYRADMDALPTQDAKRVPYASCHPGVAHLCGHDAHTTVAVGVALLLHHMRDQLHGRVRVFFQPNEEGTPGGANEMIADGVLDGLEAAYAIHVDPNLSVGRFGLITGAATAAADRFRFEVRSHTTGHSARPHEGVDTIWIATQIAQTLYQQVGRISDARNAAVITICRFRGGEAYNVIPSCVEFGGTFRCTSEDDRRLLKAKMHRLAEHYADLYDTRVTLHYEDGAPAVRNDARLARHVERTVTTLFGEHAVYHIPRPSMGAEDFAHYLDHIPGLLLRVGTSSSPETSYPLHDASFDLDESALTPAAFLMAHVLLGHLRQHVL